MLQKEWISVKPARTSPAISHLLFADYLLLFGKASFSEAHSIEHVLASFCSISWQRINHPKSKIWFSPNTPTYLRNAICSEFRFTATCGLGTYLGMPLLHGHVKNTTFNYVLDKAHRRLDRWKAKLLSRASRLILLKSILTALPAYAMQTRRLPRCILHGLDRLCQ